MFFDGDTARWSVVVGVFRSTTVKRQLWQGGVMVKQ